MRTTVTAIPMLGIGYDSEIIEKYNPITVGWEKEKVQRIQILFIKISIYSKV